MDLEGNIKADPIVGSMFIHPQEQVVASKIVLVDESTKEIYRNRVLNTYSILMKWRGHYEH